VGYIISEYLGSKCVCAVVAAPAWQQIEKAFRLAYARAIKMNASKGVKDERGRGIGDRGRGWVPREEDGKWN